MKLLAAILIVALLSLVGCGKKGSGASSSGQSPDAEAQVRAAIQERVASNSNLNLQAFDTDIKQITIDGDHAQAQVDFRLKSGPGAMQLTYRLEKREGKWVVLDSNPTGDSSHPSLDQGQASVPGAPGDLGGGSHSLADTLRSFKLDGSGGSSSSLPPGHPPVTHPPGAAPQ